jgi:hypothetical protein
MKFENIKKGETVYIRYKVSSMGGYHRSLYGEYFLPKEVTNVTPKFFDADGMRFYKEGGRERKSGYECKTAYNMGDTAYGEEVKDQTSEYKNAMSLLRQLEKARSLIFRYHVDHKIWSEEDLDLLVKLLTKNKKDE